MGSCTDQMIERLRLLSSGQYDVRSVALADAADEIERLRAERDALLVTLGNESRRPCASEADCVLQPHCANYGKCMRPYWSGPAINIGA